LTVPRCKEPAINVTVPVGTTVGEITLAVNFTVCPCFEGFREDITAVVVTAWSTDCAMGDDVLFPESMSPPYNAVS
jgi:hypothetical protein